jgi:hypothetical protein
MTASGTSHHPWSHWRQGPPSPKIMKTHRDCLRSIGLVWRGRKVHASGDTTVAFLWHVSGQGLWPHPEPYPARWVFVGKAPSRCREPRRGEKY